MGIWSALTIQGKLALAAAVILGLTVVGYLYGDDGSSGSANSPGFSLTPIQAQVISPIGTAALPTRIVSTTPQTGASPQVTASTSTTPGLTTPGITPTGQTAIAATTPTTGAPAGPTATSPAAEPTQPPPTPVPAAPTAVPTPEPPPPTPAPACSVAASVSGAAGDQTASATLTCAGAPVNGATMSAVFLYQALSGGCGGTSNASGSASCTFKTTDETGPFIQVEVCFSHNGRYCGTATL